MPGGRKKRVLIVDDSALVRQTLSELVSAHPELEVMSTAGDPFIAAERLKKEVPDVITLDVEMPRMDGITFLRRLMAQRPIPVVICSSIVPEGSEQLFAAFEAGAVDVIQKPVVSTRQFFLDSAEKLGRTLLAAASAKPRRYAVLKGEEMPALKAPDLDPPAAPLPPPTKVIPRRAARPSKERIVVIGASTGGTEALRRVLQSLPPNAPPIAIVQHMPEAFTSAFADRLDKCSQISVREAKDGDQMMRGLALIAPGHSHIKLLRRSESHFVHLDQGPPVNLHRPSVDVLFFSAAEQLGENAVGVLMTGMGKDGAQGMQALRQLGARTFGQNEQSCVVYGMSREAKLLGAVEREAALEEIPALILRYGREQTT